jgi:hypothetical protein
MSDGKIYVYLYLAGELDFRYSKHWNQLIFPSQTRRVLSPMPLYPFDFLAILLGQDTDVDCLADDMERYLKEGQVGRAEMMMQTLLLAQLQRRHPGDPQVRKLIEKHVVYVEEAWPGVITIVPPAGELTPEKLQDFGRRTLQTLDNLLYAHEHVAAVPLIRELEPYLAQEKVSCLYMLLQEIELYTHLPRATAVLSLGSMVRQSLRLFDGWDSAFLARMREDEDVHQDLRALFAKLYD